AEGGNPLDLRAKQALALLATGLARGHVDLLGCDLDLRLWLGLEVVVPGRVLGSSALGGEHGVAAVVALVDERVDSSLDRPRAGVVQEEHRQALERSADAPLVGAELLDD